MPRPVSNPNTMISQAFAQLTDAYIRENLETLLEELDIKPGSGGSAKAIVLSPLEEVQAEIEGAHPLLDTALKMARRGGVYLYGPAGTGKSTIARHVAKALDVSCYTQGRVESEFQLFGFRDGRGEYQRTPFRDAFEHGGVYLLDELDRCDGTALTALNDALASGEATFPDGVTVTAHESFHFIGTGNTALRGDEGGFSAAVEQDGALADRLAFLFVDYDEEFERSMVPAKWQDWAKRVQALRKAAGEAGVSLTCTPRAIVRGAELMNDGLTQAQAEDALIWRGLDEASRKTVERLAKRGED